MIIRGVVTMKNTLRRSKYQDSVGNNTVKKAPTTYGGTVCSWTLTTLSFGYCGY